MSRRHIRPATAGDREVAVPLLLSAAQRLLSQVFGLGEESTALTFLHTAWNKGVGQYGFANHSVLELRGRVIGLISSWHDQLPRDFDRCTLNSIIDFHGIDTALEVVLRSQQYLAVLDPPSPTQVAIGHLSVASQGQRQGVGRALVAHKIEQARTLNKQAVVLNCENDNHQALAFYHALGFEEQGRSSAFTQLVKPV